MNEKSKEMALDYDTWRSINDGGHGWSVGDLVQADDMSDLHSSGHCISHSLRSDQLQNTDSKLLQETFGYSSDMSLPARCFYKPVDAQSADWTEQKPSIRDSPRPLPPVPQILY